MYIYGDVDGYMWMYDSHTGIRHVDVCGCMRIYVDISGGVLSPRGTPMTIIIHDGIDLDSMYNLCL